MHTCLTIQEVLDKIFWELPESSYEQNKPTLVALAATCKCFHELAIKYLWHTLPSFAPILKILPQRLLSRDSEAWTDTINLTMWSPSSGLEQAFPRMQHYARHVRVLLWPKARTVDSYRVHSSAFRKLYEHQQFRGPLFPNLHRVQLPCISKDNHAATFYPAIVLSPSVHEVEVYTDDAADVDIASLWHDGGSASHWDDLVSRLVTVSATLTKFDVINPYYSPYWGFSLVGKRSVLEAVLSTFTSLKALDITTLVVSGATLISLQEIPTLEILRITLVLQHHSELSNTSLRFPSLQHLVISVLSLQSCERFLSLLRTTCLAKIAITEYTDEGEGMAHDNYDPEPLFSALLKGGMFTTLQDIELSKRYLDEDYGDSWLSHLNEKLYTLTPGTTLAPLRRFRNLKRLEIEPCDTSRIDDAEFRETLAAWPKLNKLCLPDESCAEEPPRLTIEGVHEALKNAPMLNELRIRFDGRTIPLSVMDEDNGGVRRGLTYWHAGSSWITSGDDFAVWLKRHYPELKAIGNFYWYREALDMVYEHGEPDDEDQSRIQPYRHLAKLVDKWNDVLQIYKESALAF
ncbi:hypothetical protein BKA70DRAFT_829397 [Coprinopsis sp. MPI-PUGE-AT-0042]|nr:hypothetical protein BKA70DRAFT_829397 [Coprinopsis sp. MPI-PUGE-AT-0042]